jgi:fluoroquinolone transport system permease protein
MSVQLRSGYWTVYGIIGIIYILILYNLPAGIRDDVAVLMIFMDTSVLGLTFVGAMVLFEKNQGVIYSLSVSPLKIRQYLFSKTLSLTLLSVLVSSLIWLVPERSLRGYVYILSDTALSSVVFTMFGLGFAAGTDSFNQYMAKVFAGSLIISAPLLPMIILPGAGWLIIFPANAGLDLFFRVTGGSFSPVQLADILVLMIWSFLMFLYAIRQFHKHNLFL